MSRSLSLEEDSEVFTASISSMCAKFYEDSSEKKLYKLRSFIFVTNSLKNRRISFIW